MDSNLNFEPKKSHKRDRKESKKKHKKETHIYKSKKSISNNNKGKFHFFLFYFFTFFLKLIIPQILTFYLKLQHLFYNVLEYSQALVVIPSPSSSDLSDRL